MGLPHFVPHSEYRSRVVILRQSEGQKTSIESETPSQSTLGSLFPIDATLESGGESGSRRSSRIAKRHRLSKSQVKKGTKKNKATNDEVAGRQLDDVLDYFSCDSSQAGNEISEDVVAHEEEANEVRLFKKGTLSGTDNSVDNASSPTKSTEETNEVHPFKTGTLSEADFLSDNSSSPKKSTSTPAKPRNPSHEVEKSATKPRDVKKLEYTKLKDCTNEKKRYNVWAVCTKVTREPKRTSNKMRWMTQMYIQDEDSDGTFDYPDYQFSIISKQREEIPPIQVQQVKSL